MTSARGIQVPDNLERTAQDLVDFILKDTPTVEAREKHKDILLGLINDVKDKYERTGWRLPFISLFESIVHIYSRRRRGDIEIAKNELHKALPDDKIAFLYIIAGLMTKGACDTTSANTLLLDGLIAKLPQYHELNEDARLNKLGWHADAAKTGVREMLRDLFVKKAQWTIAHYEKLEANQRKLIASERPQPGKLKIDETFKAKLGSAVARADNGVLLTRPEKIEVIENYQPARNIKIKYADVISQLETQHGAKPRAMKSEAFDDTKSRFEDARQTLSLFMRHPPQDDDANSHLASPAKRF